MLMYDIISKKRDGYELSAAEIDFWISGYTQGVIPDYQCSALLMAGLLQGFTKQETLAMVESMITSGERIDLSDIEGIKADKHSTGGVGDKTSLVVMPIIAAAGLKVAKMSGRGLGHTGGTLDKLAAIPGCYTELTTAEFKQQVREIGIAIISQTAKLVPADKKLYALRDATATVDSLALIAASIMSKKIATGADILALDVKYGSGAFMQNLADSRALAQLMVELAQASGIKTVAVLSSMEQPLGLAIGNALEVKEAAAVLTNNGPDDLRELSLTLAAELILLAGLAPDRAQAVDLARQQLTSGAALAKFCQMIAAQGGDTDFSHLPVSPLVVEYRARESGYLTAIDARKIGLAALCLGAGRQKKEDVIDPAAGIILRHKLAERVETGEVLAEVHCRTQQQFAAAREILDDAFALAADIPETAPLISDIIS